MGLEEKINGDVVILPIEGKITGGSETITLSNQLQKLITQGYYKIILDFDQVKWINSPGISVLIKWLMILRENGGDLRLTNTKTKVEHCLKITKLKSYIKTYKRPQEAINSFSIPISI